ncbi:MAG: branched-chain amino acid ABC transporter permease [Symbiobacterium sp.]|uniref:branched-chain amino acid ABC transporter permease n=1 Tax=Symbiobacterium sp. TaxID=1971213 RepID=UPI00346498E4
MLRLRKPEGGWLGVAVPAAVILFLALLPFLPGLGSNRYLLALLIGAFVFAVFAMSFDVLLGYTGIVSFGHALFFGTGTYAAILLAKYMGAGFWTALAVAPVVAAVLALIVGSLSLRVKGVYFAMVSMAFAEFFRVVAEKASSITGGSDGLAVQVAPDWAYGPRHRVELYFLTLALAVVTYLVLRRVLASPFGRTLVAIRENEQRAAALGYNVFAFKLGSLVLAGMVASLAGVMYAATENFVVPSVVGVDTTIQVLLMSIIGGVGTLGGPALGAGIIRLAGTLLSSYTERWRLALGALYALLVLFLPSGLAGLARAVGRRLEARRVRTGEGGVVAGGTARAG